MELIDLEPGMMPFDAFHIRYRDEPVEIFSSRFACVKANYAIGDLVETLTPSNGVLTAIEKIDCESEAQVILVLVDGFFLDYVVCRHAEEASELSAAVAARWSDRDCQAAAFRLLARRHAVAWRSCLQRIHEIRLAVRVDERQAALSGEGADAHLRQCLSRILAADSPAWPAWNV